MLYFDVSFIFSIFNVIPAQFSNVHSFPLH